MSHVTLLSKSRVHDHGDLGTLATHVNKKHQQRRAHVRSFDCHSRTNQTVLSSNCLSSAPEYLLHNDHSILFTHSNPPCEQGTRARLNLTMICVPYGASVTMRLETLMPAQTNHGSVLQRWTSASQMRVLCHGSPFVLCLCLHSRQADRELIASRLYKFSTDPWVQRRVLPS